MPGRNPIPIDVQAQAGRLHISHDNVEIRRAAEAAIFFGSAILSPPFYLRGNRLALRRFRQVRRDYFSGGKSFITSSDCEFLARYCERWAAYRKMQKWRDDFGKDEMDEALRLEMKLKLLNDSLKEMEEHLFLTPLSKIRAIPKRQEKQEKTPLEKQGFGHL